MKKIISFLVAVLMLSVICISAFAAEYPKAPSADEKWWEWFNSLTPEQQACINFRPSTNAKTADNSIPRETEIHQGDESSLSPFAGLLPTGGGEPVYNYEYWESHKKYANCYIYAIDVITTTIDRLRTILTVK